MNATSASSLPPSYVGRFAPSPTGPLHFGSLVSALASYAHARAAGGQWLVRMEDLDPPREQPGAKDAILESLDNHGLHWDGPVVYQSQRLEAYAHTLEQLQQAGLVYPCTCTRDDLRAMGGVYDGRCRQREVDLSQPHALRLKLYDVPPGVPTLPDVCQFDDLIQGPQAQNLRLEVGDQIIKRKDGLFSYQLAVVVDDIAQHISHVVRGSDLLEVSARQIALFQLLGEKPPLYGHVPLALNTQGQKLSKQSHAPALNDGQAGANLWHALVFLNQSPPEELAQAPADEVLAWAVSHWRTPAIRGLSKPESQATTEQR
ncbi:tRNA glutamyl-Q(34) synthetase GluQRS [Marinimicrobium sp. ABcell2]|uniref:tRNA glutamyl-Q(34) synthetase GluQRS n=1 Tax=Marinimicrobium sp. ABcell2 TaxID=3069751 RepID=UPI0027AEF675|nr:tRNA glutamyl-Q(34) synthetase GluQRS [Marinimicrobium sp. ABcell2]MDQ2077675.1 tRNA glutamyl-Q(34) synthetase GluQRS [Marinimicrobium sp. ABcell2]